MTRQRQAGPTQRERARHPSALWPSILLGLVLVLAKAVHWGWPPTSHPELAWWARDWAISAHQDILFAVGFGLVAQACLLLAGRWPRLRRWVFRGILATGTLFALYAVISVGVFGFLRSPLTYPLLYLAGGVSDMRSSVGGVGNAAIYAAFVLVPLGYWLAAFLMTRGAARGLTARRATVLALGVLVLAGSVGWARHSMTDRWLGRSDALIVRSPHWAFLESSIAVACGHETPAFEHDFPPGDLDDFRPKGSPLPLPHPDPPRNVITLVLESNTATYMSLYGSVYPTTPHLEAAARNAVVFDAFYSPVGLTANVLVSLNLSVYPFMTWREYTVEYPDYPGRTLAQELRERGYRTLFIHTGHLEYTNQQGFLAGRGYEQVLDWDELGRGQPEVSSWGGDDHMLIDRLFEWIDSDPDRSFYAMAWTINSHHPYEPAPGQESIDFFAGLPDHQRPADEWDLGRYLNTVRETDRHVGRLFAGLEERGLADETLVVITGDHGQAFGHPHPTWGHGFRLYQENVHVPMVVWNPRLFPEGERRDTVGSHVDVSPTIAHLLGLPAAPSWQGRSLFAPSRPPRAYFYAANDFYLLGVRQDNWKYVYNATHGTEELFDLATDPVELDNVAAEHPELCERLRQRLAAWRSFAQAELQRAGYQ